MTLAVFSVVIAVATLLYTAVQSLLTLLLTQTQSWEQKRNKLLGYRWFWRASIGVTTLSVAFLLAVVVIRLQNWGQPLQDAVAEAASESEDESEMKQVVKNSQVSEFLNIYGDPQHFDRRQLSRYWLPGSEARRDIDICLKHLNTEGWHYGVGSKLVTFEFRYVRVFGDRGEVGTIEHWYLPLFDLHGLRVTKRNPDIGPYNVDYTLKKTNGQWFLETTTTPYIHKQGN
jgi:hypothetical protein